MFVCCLLVVVHNSLVVRCLLFVVRCASWFAVCRLFVCLLVADCGLVLLVVAACLAFVVCLIVICYFVCC